MLTVIAKLLKALNSESEPWQLSMAFCLSMIAGLTPLCSLHNLLILLLALILRINLSTFLLGLAFFTGMAFILDPLFHWIGLTLLTASPLTALWTALYNSTLWRIERFNNSIVMGSLVFSLLLFVPLYLLLNEAIRRYREHVLEWIHKTRIMKAFTTSKLYHVYQSVSGWGSSA